MLVNVCIDSHPVVACEVLVLCGLGEFHSYPQCIIPDRYFCDTVLVFHKVYEWVQVQEASCWLDSCFFGLLLRL